MKKALLIADRTGLTKDPLAAARKFGERRQESNESIRDFELSLRKLFMEAYPKDCVDTSIAFSLDVLFRDCYQRLPDRCF